MSILVNNYKAVEIILVTLFASIILVPLARVIAKHIGAMDIPNERKIHKKPMPRLGGLAIYGSFLIGYILYGKLNYQMISILIGSFIILLLGVFDDIKPIKARYKFLVQILAALLVVIYGKIYFTEITFLGLELKFNLFVSYTLSTIFIVAISNAINLIDGMDGLSSGISSIYFITIGIIAFLLHKTTGLDFTLTLIMFGATLGFLFWNFPPAKIFMGDSGSLFLGFMISVIAIIGFKIATLTSLIIPIIILAIPIFDTIFAIFRRLIKHQNVAMPDKDHIHHQLLKMRYSPIGSILIIYAIDIVFAVISIYYAVGNREPSIALYCIVIILLLFVIFRTNILFNHKNNKEKEEEIK